MKKPKVVVAIVVAVLILIVVMQNTESVQTRILFATITMPRALLLFANVVLGFLLGLWVGARRLGAR